MARHVLKQQTPEMELFEGVLSQSEADRALEVLRGLEIVPGSLDSVDKHASFQLELVSNGSWVPNPELAQLRAILERPLEGLVERVRAWDGGRTGELRPAYVIVRRYALGERREHPVHFDFHSLVTAVSSISRPQPHSGLFVQRGAPVASREYVELKAAGDFAVHRWDLAHGVDIIGDEERFSLIVWFYPMEGQQGHWCETLAQEGYGQAQYRLGMVCSSAGDDVGAEHWLRRAAEQDQWFAKHQLGKLYLRRGDLVAAETWLRAAASQGYSEAQVDLADLASTPRSEATELYAAAAAQGHRKGQWRAAHTRLESGDRAGGLELLQASAEKGWAVAQLDLAHLLRQSSALGEADEWCARAAAQGHPDGAEQLALGASMSGDDVAARSWWEKAARLGSTSAMRSLANCLERGVGGPADPEMSAQWRQRAGTDFLD